jgi:putative thioredoxin
MDEADALLAAGDAQAALAKLADAWSIDPDNDDARFDYANLLIAAGALDQAAAVLKEPLAREPRPPRFDALDRWLDAVRFVKQNERGAWTIERFDARIAGNERDFDLRFAKARALMAEGRWAEALDELLEIITRDKKWNGEIARKTYVAILELLSLTRAAPADEARDGAGATAGGIELAGKTAVKSDPRTALISSYRRKLSGALN